MVISHLLGAGPLLPEVRIWLECPGPAALVVYGWCPFTKNRHQLLIFPTPFLGYHPHCNSGRLHAAVFFPSVTKPSWSQIDGPEKGTWPKHCRLDPFQEEFRIGSFLVYMIFWTTTTKMKMQEHSNWKTRQSLPEQMRERKQWRVPTEKGERDLESWCHLNPWF